MGHGLWVYDGLSWYKISDQMYVIYLILLSLYFIVWMFRSRTVVLSSCWLLWVWVWRSPNKQSMVWRNTPQKPVPVLFSWTWGEYDVVTQQRVCGKHLPAPVENFTSSEQNTILNYRPRSRGDNTFGSVRLSSCPFVSDRSHTWIVWPMTLIFGMRVDLDLG